MTHPVTWPIKARAEIGSYTEANDFLNGEMSRILAANTMIRRGRSGIEIVLYDTAILCYSKDSTFQADNGGFNTPTTSARLNQFGPEGWSFYHDHGKLIATGPMDIRVECTPGRIFSV